MRPRFPFESTVVLVVDDEQIVRTVLQRGIERAGFVCLVAEDGVAAIEVLENAVVDVVVTDISMPRMDGIQLTDHIRQHHNAAVIVMTGLDIDYHYEEFIRRGASDFLHKPIRLPEFLARLRRVVWERQTRADLDEALQEVHRSLELLRGAMQGVVTAISTAVEMRDPYTAGHQQRVADLASALAVELLLPAEQTQGLRVAAAMHDLGKLSVPTEILIKPGRLSELELRLVREHVQAGYHILQAIEFPWPVADIVLQHHERMNGSGYPGGLHGEEILMEARILAVADVLETMSSHRPYRPSRGLERATQELTHNAGTLYDPDVVQACLALYGRDELRVSAPTGGAGWSELQTLPSPSSSPAPAPAPAPGR